MATYKLNKKRKDAIAIKTSVREIYVPKRLLRTTVDKDLELEEALPDFCPDISRLIRVDCTPIIESSDINENKCLVVGKVVCRILYETDYKNKIKSALFTKEFNQSFDVQSQSCVNPVAETSTRCTHISCKMLSPRKFIIKPRLKLDLDVFGNTAIKTVDTRSGDNTFYRTNEISFEKRIASYTEDFTFSEEIPLLQNEKPIGDIVFGSVSLQPPQVTMTGNDALVKTNATVKLLYEEDSSENELIMVTKTVPVSMTLSNLEVDETGRIAVSLSVAEEKVTGEIDAYGENKVIKASFIAKAKADMTERVSEIVATDLFSSDYISKTDNIDIAFPTQLSEFDRTFALDTVVMPERPLTAPLFDTDITINELKTELAEGGVRLNGGYTVSVLGRTAEEFESFDFSGEFEELIPIDLPDNVVDVESGLFPFDYTTTIMSDNSLSLRIILNAKIRTFTEDKQTIISTVSAQEPVTKEKENYAVVYYFPDSKDDLWSIAKKYYVNPSVVREANPTAFDEWEQVKSGTKMVLIKK